MFRSKSLDRRRAAPARTSVIISIVLALLALAVVPAWAAAAKPFPEVIPLPNGWQPEGIVSGRGTDFYVGSLADGSIYKGNYRTGEGEVLVQAPADGRIAVGMAFDLRTDYLFVASGPLGEAYVYDTLTGESVAKYQLTMPGAGFVNDVIVTNRAAYFTDSFQAQLYRVPMAPGGGLPQQAMVETISLPGDFATGPGVFGANGIEATPDGKLLILVHSSLGALYRVDTESEDVTLIDLDGASVSSGDGLLLEGKRLYVVRNFLNEIAVVELDRWLTSGTLVDTLTDPDLRIPTTVAGFGNALYAVNARFDVTPSPDTEYEVVRLLER